MAAPCHGYSFFALRLFQSTLSHHLTPFLLPSPLLPHISLLDFPLFSPCLPQINLAASLPANVETTFSFVLKQLDGSYGSVKACRTTMLHTIDTYAIKASSSDSSSTSSSSSSSSSSVSSSSSTQQSSLSAPAPSVAGVCARLCDLVLLHIASCVIELPPPVYAPATTTYTMNTSADAMASSSSSSSSSTTTPPSLTPLPPSSLASSTAGVTASISSKSAAALSVSAQPPSPRAVLTFRSNWRVRGLYVLSELLHALHERTSPPSTSISSSSSLSPSAALCSPAEAWAGIDAVVSRLPHIFRILTSGHANDFAPLKLVEDTIELEGNLPFVPRALKLVSLWTTKGILKPSQQDMLQRFLVSGWTAATSLATLQSLNADWARTGSVASASSSLSSPSSTTTSASYSSDYVRASGLTSSKFNRFATNFFIEGTGDTPGGRIGIDTPDAVMDDASSTRNSNLSPFSLSDPMPTLQTNHLPPGYLVTLGKDTNNYMYDSFGRSLEQQQQQQGWPNSAPGVPVTVGTRASSTGIPPYTPLDPFKLPANMPPSVVNEQADSQISNILDDFDKEAAAARSATEAAIAAARSKFAAAGRGASSIRTSRSGTRPLFREE